RLVTAAFRVVSLRRVLIEVCDVGPFGDDVPVRRPCPVMRSRSAPRPPASYRFDSQAAVGIACTSGSLPVPTPTRTEFRGEGINDMSDLSARTRAHPDPRGR